MKTNNRNIRIYFISGGDALTYTNNKFYDLSAEAFTSSTQRLGVICSRIVEEFKTPFSK